MITSDEWLDKYNKYYELSDDAIKDLKLVNVVNESQKGIYKSFWARYNKKFNTFNIDNITKEQIPLLNKINIEIREVLIEMSQFFDNKIISLIHEKYKLRQDVMRAEDNNQEKIWSLCCEIDNLLNKGD